MTININGTEYQGPLYLSDTGAMVLDAKGVVFLNFMQQTDETRPKVQAMIAALNAMNTTQGEYGACPFCGGEGSVQYGEGQPDGIIYEVKPSKDALCRVSCLKDDCVANDTTWFDSIEQARAAWNTRSGMADPATELSKLREIAEAAKRADGFPEIVCLCGSTRFTDEMLVRQWELTKQGIIVLSWCAVPESYFKGPHVGDAEGVKEIVDEVHKRKIDLSNRVHVMNIGGYIGDSTKSEVGYALKHGKPVTWAEPEHADENLSAVLRVKEAK